MPGETGTGRRPGNPAAQPEMAATRRTTPAAARTSGTATQSRPRQIRPGCSWPPAVIALVPAGRRRAWWGAAAVAFSIVMGLSRAYLAAHWLSDATAGMLLGTSCALLTALVADQFRRRQTKLQPPARTQRPAGAPTAHHAEDRR
jgi:PAP2 superfamily